MDITVYAIPAILALVAKAVIYLYARYSPIRNLETRLYLFFLFALSIQNVAEINVFSSFAKHYPEPTGGILYFGASIVAIALLLHLALVLSGSLAQRGNKYVAFIYLPTGILELLLWGTDRLVAGFEPVQYTYTKIPGSLYFLFEIYTLGYFVAVLALLVYGTKRKTSTTYQRLKNKIMLFGLLPFIALVLLIVGLQHFGMRLFNTTATLPIALTFFLAVTVYATHQYRLFDIAYIIPWSKVRARKTAFYDRIRAMIAEIADLGSVREAVLRLADTLRCPVALVSTGKPVLAVAGGAQQMVAFPLEYLHRIDRIVVANEIADSDPATYKLMQSHGVAAIVPFYPHSHSASGWMLLGDKFSEQVYTPLDFKMVEQLFDKMAELFLDKLLFMRTQLAAAERRLQMSELRLQQTEAGLTTLRGEIESLREQNRRLAREQVADSLIAAETPAHGALPSIILLGRDKPMLKLLRRHFPQADQYVGPDSASFRRQDPPEVLVCRLDADRGADDAWLALLTQQHGRVAALLYGNGAQEFIATHLEPLAGALVEILPDDATDEAIARRIQALANLHRGALAVPDADCPLIGVSQPFQEAMRDAARLAGFVEPVLIESGDARELATVARYIHSLSGRPGEFHMRPAHLTDTLAAYEGGTLLLTGADTLAPETLEPLIATTGKARLLLGAENAGESLRARFRSFALRLPTLRERRLDLPLLVHYFTLQYNLRAGTQTYLTQTDVDELMAVRYPANMDALRAEVFDRLNAKHRVSAPAPEMELALADKTLDEHVATFEARLIAQTLERCQGNKSKAARLLGLRPNTLHYKLERYGLGGKKDKSETN
ncbi:MAG: hypothetical protein EPN55_00395 [Gammaproteobacteria bacterium]|nr:MAG: hypothetical protein EPN55_00395 [Gammaproteobacteria bacterium]